MAGKRIIVFCLFTLVTLALGAFASSGTQAQSYKGFHGYALTTSTAVNANSDSDSSVGIYIPDYNYEDSSMFTFTPIDMWGEMGYNAPIGAKVGELNALSTVGVAGAACAGPLTPSFKMHNASTDTTVTLDADAMYWLLKDKDAEEIPFDDLPDPPYDDDLPDYLEAYPEFLNVMFDPDGTGPEPPLVPRARYAGHTTTIANMNILVQIVVFNPGQLALLPGIYQQMGPEVGSPSVVVLNNPVTAEEAPGAITDFCTPLDTTTTLYHTTKASLWGTGGAGYVRQQNPSAGAGVLGSGTIISRNYSRSERDADGDGIENDLDPCHYSPTWVNDGCDAVGAAEATYECANGLDDDGDTKINDGCAQVGLTGESGTECDNAYDDDGDPNTDSSWDPRAAGGAGTGDEDGDGLPDSCDPHPNTFENDEDDDGYTNKQDICPLVADGEDETNQQDSDTTLPNDDLGPGPDSIGDACDDSDGDGSEDGAGAGTCTDGVDNGNDGAADELDSDCDSAWDASDSTPWGTNPGTGLFYHAMPWSAACVGGTDADFDGYCDSLENTLGSPADNGPEYDQCANAIDDDSADDGGSAGDWVNDGCPVKGTVSEADISGACDITDDVDDDDDGLVNDGCPKKGAASEYDECANAVTDDSDSYVNDGCPVVGFYAEAGDECKNATSDDTPTPDADEQTLGVAVNDGCPAIGVPESLVIDVPITAGDAQPSNAVPQSCSDGIDNDGDTDIDGDDDANLGCDSSAGHGYDNDADTDGVADTTDNCGKSGTDLVWNPEQTDTDGAGVGDACDNDDDNDGFRDVDEWKAGSDPLDVGSSTPEVCDGVDNDGDGSVDEGFTDTDADTVPDCYEDDLDSDGDGSEDGCDPATHPGTCKDDIDNGPDCDGNGTDGADGDDSDCAPAMNDADDNDDSWWEDSDSSWHNDLFPDDDENYYGTDKEVKCWTSGNPVDADPFDSWPDGEMGLLDGMKYYEPPHYAYGAILADDDQGYNRRLDLWIDYDIGLLDGMLWYQPPPAYGNSCPYGK